MKLFKTSTKNKSGFTLIELLVVIAIIGILSSVVLASLSGARESAKVAKMVSDFEQIETGMTLWMDSTGTVQWPSETDYTADNVNGTLINTMRDESSLSEYLNQAPEPPFGTTGYTYDNDNDTSSCGSRYDGVSVRVTWADNLDLKEEIDRQIDGSIDNDCGKFKWSEGGGVMYYLSEDGNL